VGVEGYYMLYTLCVVLESDFFFGVGGGSARPCPNFLAFCCSSTAPLPSAIRYGWDRLADSLGYLCNPVAYPSISPLTLHKNEGFEGRLNKI